ncbi:MAG: bifunctional riboflavin kinase/FAD synthetase [Anaerolineales bacterium]|nr:bifunctional riboflavin kinase/FAD synthetase [Anaerolineales bacterium]
MSHYHSLDDVSLQNSWLTIGVFDGVHRGHQEIIRQLTEGAHADGALAVVLTFFPHPAVVLGRKADFKSLTTPGERVALLGALGVDVVITHPFDRALADQTAEVFMRHVARNLGLRRLLIGHDFALGRGREGNYARLSELGASLGYEVRSIAPLAAGNEVISSTRIRAQIAAGDVSRAAVDLGRYYTLRGSVIHGDGRGKKINIPTANLEIPAEKVIPANGVYVCRARVGDEGHAAVTNVGIRPTFTPEEYVPHVEAHLLDFDRDLYGQEVTLEFVERLREERKFPSVEALVEQIQADIGRARQILDKPPRSEAREDFCSVYLF